MKLLKKILFSFLKWIEERMKKIKRFSRFTRSDVLDNLFKIHEFKKKERKL